jgi:hypothetical protein
MKPIQKSILSLTALLAAMPGALLAADLPVLTISPTSAPEQVKAAKAAFDSGSIVTMQGGTITGFEALLNISMPRSDSRHRQPPPCVQAARKLPSGRVRKFIRISQPFSAGDDAACNAAFTTWTARQNSLEETNIPNWTDIEDFSLPNAWNSAKGNSISLDLSVFRANTIDPKFDYYLVLSTMVLVPASNSQVFFPNAFLSYANYQNGTPAPIYGYGPQQRSSIISLGQGISFDQNATGLYQASGATAPSFAESLIAPSGTPDIVWQYIEDTSPYTYQTAMIYQFPTGTTHFTISSGAQGTFSSGDKVGGSQFILVPISAPQVLVPELTFAMEGAKSSFDVSASSYLQTALASLPGWMPQGSIQYTDPNGAETQTPPLGSFTISFNVPGNPACLTNGTCANPGNITLQTVPAYAAMQTKLPAISATTIELVPNSPTAGVLIAGGRDWNGTVLKTADVWNSTTGTTTPLQPQMVEARYQHTATLIAPSSTCQGANVNCTTTGQVLLAGGIGENGQALSSTELYNPATTQFSPGPTMTSPHAGAVAVQLQDGRILIMGGLDQSGSATAVVDIYDPTTNTFSSTPMSLTQPRWDFAANVLQDGSVLVEGGSKGPAEYEGPASSSAEKLDNCGSGFYPLTNGPVVPRQEQATTLLKNGQVLIVGGYNGSGNLNQVELFTPSSNSFSQVTSLQSDRRASALVRQEDGDAALIGGFNVPNYSNIYDPSSQSFVDSLTTTMTEQRDFPTAVRLEGIGTADKGKILVAGGVYPSSGSSNGELVELYDPTARTWTSAGTLSASRRQNTMTLFGKYAGSLPATFGCH